MDGQAMIYLGIGLVAAAVVLWIVTAALFRSRQRKLKEKIYGEFQE